MFISRGGGKAEHDIILKVHNINLKSYIEGDTTQEVL